MKKLINLARAHRQFLFYSLIGISGVSIDVVVFFLLYNTFHIDKNFATFISLSLAISNNFTWNTIFNFKKRDKLMSRFIKFYIVGLSGFLLTALFFLVLTDWLGISANVTKLVSLLPILVLQYTINKVWSFKNYEEI
jgi:putative flippase GtrA